MMWGTIYGQQANRGNNPQTAANSNAYDILYDPQNQNIFCISSHRVSVIQENNANQENNLQTDLDQIVEENFEKHFPENEKG